MIRGSKHCVWISEREEEWRPEDQERDGWYRPRQLENRHDGVGGWLFGCLPLDLPRDGEPVELRP